MWAVVWENYEYEFEEFNSYEEALAYYEKIGYDEKDKYDIFLVYVHKTNRSQWWEQ